MNAVDVDELSENEVKLLACLESLGGSTTDAISESSGLVKDAVERASDWARTRGLVSVTEVSKELLQLTDEGLEYAEKGLPEKLLLRLIDPKGTPLASIRKKLERPEVALNWALRNNWVRIENSVLHLTDLGTSALGGKTEEEMELSSLKGVASQRPSPSLSSAVNRLVRRRLVKRVSLKVKTIQLTEKGRQLLPRIKSGKAAPSIAQLTPEILRSERWRGATLQRYDVSFPVPRIYPGRRHFVQEVIEYIRRIWLDMGFKEMTGPMVEPCFWVFDALYQPQDHPARDLADTFYMKTPRIGRLPDIGTVDAVKQTHENGWTTGSTGWGYVWDESVAKKYCLRTHTTSLSARTLAALRDAELPAKFFSVGRVFRNETIDWKHLAEFHHTDGIVVGEGVTFRNLLGYLKNYLDKMGVKKARFRPSYFPYTEMSCEAEIWDSSKGQWMELFGAGIFRPEVVKPLLGRDVPVLAWGPGFERIVMSQYDIQNMRDLYMNDLGLVRDAKLWLR